MIFHGYRRNAVCTFTSTPLTIVLNWDTTSKNRLEGLINTAQGRTGYESSPSNAKAMTRSVFIA
jgi:hypothetical protein